MTPTLTPASAPAGSALRAGPDSYPESVHVAVVEDEERLAVLIGRYLAEFEMTCVLAHDGPAGLDAARGVDVDVVVLDRMLPGMDGVEVCRRLRAGGSDVPVLMLTARGAVAERVEGLESGADDYLVKPFAMEELAARVRALGRRRLTDSTDRWTVGDVVLDLPEHRAWLAGEPLDLGRREFAMLAALMADAGRVVSRQRLFEEVWPDGVDINSNALDVHVSRVRRALAASANVRITTLRGVGYRLDQHGG